MLAKIRRLRQMRVTIATRLTASFLIIIAAVSIVFSIAGIALINNRIVSEAQERVRLDLNAARVIYANKLNEINDLIRLTADRYTLRDVVISGNVQLFADELIRVKERENLDVLTITDKQGTVLFRASNAQVYGDDQSRDELVAEVLRREEPASATCIVPAEELYKESPALAKKAHFTFIDTPMARARAETEQNDGMMLKAAAPIFDYQNHLIGVVYGGILLNRNYEIVDKVKQTVFQDVTYRGKDIGTATIFQDDVRISTNVLNTDGTRAVGTRVAEEVYNQVVVAGNRWVGRAFVVNDWYISAYEPIVNYQKDQIIGILYVGTLELKYRDMQREAIVVYLLITLSGVLASVGLSYFVSTRITSSIQKLALASREIAHGKLDAKVDIRSRDEFWELAETFNFMASALKERDERLKEFTTKKIMESERLALIGQLAAGVAHELNNPLQGIVAYSNLLLERTPDEDARRSLVQKIVHQADRCRDIIRGLLDFSRQRKPDKTVCNIHKLLDDCVALIGNQAIFHDIQIVKNYHPTLPLVVLDPSQVERVFMNMIINAAQAMEKGGQLTLTTRVDAAGKNVEIEIQDTGVGISPENLEKVFDPFFTTKEYSHGVGLGLAISYGIIKEHNGTISVDSEVGKGTTFVISLPVAGENHHDRSQS